MTTGFSLKEAAAIVDVPEPVVRKAIEARTIRPRRFAAGRARRYRFAVKDMLYLKLVSHFPLGLAKRDKAALRHLMEGRRRHVGQWQAAGDDLVIRSGGLEIRVGLKSMRDTLANDLATYRRGRRRVVSDPAILGGEPVFEGTRIPLAHVAALIAKRVPLDAIAEDYPALGRADLTFAVIHAKMKRDPGRPRKPLRLLRGGVALKPPRRRTARAAAD